MRGERMQLKKLLEKWDLTSLSIKMPFLEMQWEPRDEDKIAAWELYFELITRAATQGLDPDEGAEAAALKSIYDLFPLTRNTIKRNSTIRLQPALGEGRCSQAMASQTSRIHLARGRSASTGGRSA